MTLTEFSQKSTQNSRIDLTKQAQFVWKNFGHQNNDVRLAM